MPVDSLGKMTTIKGYRVSPLTRVLKKTPCSTDLVAIFKNTIGESRMSLLETVSKIDTRDAGANDYNIEVVHLRIGSVGSRPLRFNF